MSERLFMNGIQGCKRLRRSPSAFRTPRALTPQRCIDDACASPASRALRAAFSLAFACCLLSQTGSDRGRPCASLRQAFHYCLSTDANRLDMANAYVMNAYAERFLALLLAVVLLALASGCADSDGAGASSQVAGSSETAPSDIVPSRGAAARETAAREGTRGGAGGAPPARARVAADSSCDVPAPGALVDPACFRALLPENLPSRGWERAGFTAETTADFQIGRAHV